jgi:AcrR family transcriptional regulator
VAGATPLPRLPERRRRPVGEERRQALLVATERLLHERPLAEVSVGDIASAAGVTRSGFYFYYPNKAAVVTELLGDVFAEMVEGAGDFIRGAGDPAESVRAAMASTWTLWHGHQGVILAMLDARGTDPAVRELWDAWLDRFVEPLTEGIRRQRDSGHALPGPDAADLVRVLLSANERTFERLSRADGTPDEVRRVIDALSAVWSGAIYGPTSGRKP